MVFNVIGFLSFYFYGMIERMGFLFQGFCYYVGVSDFGGVVGDCDNM